MLDADKCSEVRRILDRYLIEIVEHFEFCPWAHSARVGDELAVEIVAGAPPLDAWIAAATRGLARGQEVSIKASTPRKARVVIVVAPELAIDRTGLATIRDRVAVATGAGVADFHPDATLDLTTPARLVPFLRRSPDPMLQLVPLAQLASVRASPTPDRAQQARILGGHAEPARDVSATLAAANHATASARHAAIAAAFAAIAADRQAAYARVGLATGNASR